MNLSSLSPLGPREATLITGVGALTPLGNSFEEISTNLLASRSAVDVVDIGEMSRVAVQFGAPVREIAMPDLSLLPGDPAAWEKLDRLARIFLVPMAAALADSGLTAREHGPRIGLVMGLGAEQLKIYENDFLRGGRYVFEQHRDPAMVHTMSRILGLGGPAVTAAAACASAGFALALGRKWLQAGWVDACVVGGCDMLSPTGLAAFYTLRALSRRNDDPAKASRPFDRDRDGFVMGEGGVFFVLENRGTALKRGARVDGELAGVGMSSDASHMVIPSVDPTFAAKAITLALADAGVAPDEVDYVNAHAAGTPVGDIAEAGAIRMALGSATDGVPVSSTKSMSGHLVSGAAAFEALACLTAIHHQAVPPTLNLDNPDEKCPLNHVPHTAREHRVRVAASNSFGFGGANLCLVIRQVA